VTGYCGTCRVHFTTLEEWAEHQHRLPELADRRVYGRLTTDEKKVS
jgi:ferredoxin